MSEFRLYNKFGMIIKQVGEVPIIKDREINIEIPKNCSSFHGKVKE